MENTCAICLNNQKEKELHYELPCGHGYHYKCIYDNYEHQKFQGKDGNCPLCRKYYVFHDGIDYDEILEMVSHFNTVYQVMYSGDSITTEYFHQRKNFYLTIVKELSIKLKCEIESNDVLQTFTILYNNMVIDIEWFHILN